MPTAFHTLRDNVASSAAAGRSIGGATLAVAAGTGTSFGTAFPMLVSIFRADVPITILEVTGRSGDTLTISGPAADSTDAAVLAGDTVLNANCVAYIEEIQGAVNAAEVALAGKAATVHTHTESDVTNLVSDLAGKASATHVHAAADITTGTIATARLGSGTASGTTFLRGDSTWQTPAGGGGGTTFLSGSGPPTSAVGAVGNYYEDTTGAVLYGPRGATVAEQRITVTNAPNNTDNNQENGVRVQFTRAGVITRVRYTRTAASNATLNVRIWNDDAGGAKQFEVADTRSGQVGAFEVTLPTPIAVSAGAIRTFSVGAASGVPALYASNNPVTNTTDCTFLAYRYSFPTANYPNTTMTGEAFFAEPVFEPDSIWPQSVQSIPPFTGTRGGQVVASGGGTANFLRADHTWAAPPATAAAGSTGQLQYNNAGAFGGTARVTYAASGTILLVTAGAPGDKPLILRAIASQTANLQEWQNSSSVAMASVSALGVFSGSGAGLTNLAAAGSPGQLQWNSAGAMAGTALVTYATSTVILAVNAGAAADKVLIVAGAANQTGNLSEWRNSMGGQLFTINAYGWLYTWGSHWNCLPPITPVPTVTPQGTTGSTTYSYKITAVTGIGEALPGAAATTTTGNATLSGSNYNLITWNHAAGAQYYNVYGRTAGNERLITTVITNSYADIGTPAPTTLPPTTTNGGVITIKPWVGQTQPQMIWSNSAGAAVSYVDSAGYHIMPTGSGAPATAPADGAIYIDTAGSRIYARVGGVWKSAALT